MTATQNRNNMFVFFVSFFLKKKEVIYVRMKILVKMEIEGLPPTVNLLYRNSGHVRYKTASGRKYQEHVSALLRQQWRNRLPCEKPVEFRITFTSNDMRRWDIDNRVKALQDCLSMAGIIKDDRQVDILHVERKKGTDLNTYIEVIEIDTAERISD